MSLQLVSQRAQPSPSSTADEFGWDFCVVFGKRGQFMQEIWGFGSKRFA